MPLESPNPNYRDVVERGFADAAFLHDLGIKLVDYGPGWCEAMLEVQPRHLQQTGIVHAGVQTTLADHTAGGAAMTVTPAEGFILTVEFKMHLLRPGAGESLLARAEVLKPGKAFHIVESEVFALKGGAKTLVGKFLGTMAVLPRT
ncbi:PaaI family thioesterase [Oxalobacteraceae bacterium OM1]|nr:PaaI family thioesterase [Oxalobacteraceae bacterium OM1]